MSPRLHIAVAGAGVGGLAVAIALTLAGHRVRIFDRFPEPRPVGSGLVIQPVGQMVLDWLGCGPDARAWGNPIRTLLGVEAPSGITSLIAHYDKEAPGRHGLAMHRASLFAALHRRLVALGIPLQMGVEIAGTAPVAGGSLLLDATGAQHGPFDLLVDALGAHSVLTPLVSRDLPYGALWTSLRWPEDAVQRPDHLTQRYRKARQMVGVLPIGRMPGEPGSRAAFFWSIRADRVADWRAAPLDRWKAEVLDLWPDTAPFLAQITAHDDLAFAQYAHGTLWRPWSGRLVQIGDSAHRTSPQLGQGANMALLDAAALAIALDRTTLDEALPLYARMRRGHLQIYQAMSLFLTPQYQHDSRLLADFRDRIVAPLSRIWPVPRLMGLIASGLVVPPIGGLGYRRGQPLAPGWASGPSPEQGAAPI